MSGLPINTVLVGDALEQLRTLPDESVHCVVTSPPYWGLREYGVEEWAGGDPGCQHKTGGHPQVPQTKHKAAAGVITSGGNRGGGRACVLCGAERIDAQLGTEATPAAYVARLVAVCREIRRVLRSDGVFWLNLADSMASGGNGARDAERWPKQSRNANGHRSVHTKKSADTKAKELVGIPWRVAFALQEDGWWLRRDVVWSKPSAMPESVGNRPTAAHEYVFLLAKSGAPTFYAHPRRAGLRGRKPPRPDYVWVDHTNADKEVATEPAGWQTETYVSDDGVRRVRWQRRNLWTGEDYFYDAFAVRERSANGGLAVGDRNLRDVWTFTSKPYAGAHFAVFPPDLPKRCILAGTSEGGACAACGAPRWRVVERPRPPRVLAPVGADVKSGGLFNEHGAERTGLSHYALAEWYAAHPPVSVGWQPTCECGAPWVPCVVLDPFLGSGTTAMVAQELGRRWVGVELNPAFVRLVEQRTAQSALALLG